MPIRLTEKQILLLRIAIMAIIVYLVFQYLIPMVLPFVIAALLSLLIRPAAVLLQRRLHVPIGVGAGIVLAGLLGLAGLGMITLGRLAAEQLLRLWENLPQLWEQLSHWLWDCCREMERSLHLKSGTITAQMNRMMSMDTGFLAEQNSSLLGSSLQGAIMVLQGAVSLVVTIFITIGATLITTTQLAELKRSLDRSLFRREIRRVITILARVGCAYGKTQLVIMVCTVIISAVGLTLLGDPYALLWAAVIGLVDALPIFGTGTILWPWIILSALRGQLVRTIGLAVIYALSNLLRQWLEAHYMGDKIGLSALENLIAMYLGLQLFGVLGLFWGPIGYLLIKETVA